MATEMVGSVQCIEAVVYLQLVGVCVCVEIAGLD